MLRDAYGARRRVVTNRMALAIVVVALAAGACAGFIARGTMLRLQRRDAAVDRIGSSEQCSAVSGTASRISYDVDWLVELSDMEQMVRGGGADFRLDIGGGQPPFRFDDGDLRSIPIVTSHGVNAAHVAASMFLRELMRLPISVRRSLPFASVRFGDYSWVSASPFDGLNALRVRFDERSLGLAVGTFSGASDHDSNVSAMYFRFELARAIVAKLVRGRISEDGPFAQSSESRRTNGASRLPISRASWTAAPANGDYVCEVAMVDSDCDVAATVAFLMSGHDFGDRGAAAAKAAWMKSALREADAAFSASYWRSLRIDGR